MNYYLIIPLFLGFLGVYFLLPRPRPTATLAGIGAVGLAIVLGGIFLLHRMDNWAETILFYCFSGIAILGGVLMLAQKNPVHAALSFALVVLSSCGLFLLNAAPFLMAATIIIYAGAIVVTFLFVIMLAQQAGQTGADHRSREPFLASVGGFVLMAAIIALAHKSLDIRELDQMLAQLQAAEQAKDFKEIDIALNDRFFDQLHKTFPREPTVDNLQAAWQDAKDVEQFQKLDKIMQGRVQSLRTSRGTVAEPLDLPLSKNVEPEVTGPGTLPERNVAALGKALFTDYLIPVEMAGMLLLVATIGAIAISGRRTGGLR